MHCIITTMQAAASKSSRRNAQTHLAKKDLMLWNKRMKTMFAFNYLTDKTVYYRPKHFGVLVFMELNYRPQYSWLEEKITLMLLKRYRKIIGRRQRKNISLSVENLSYPCFGASYFHGVHLPPAKKQCYIISNIIIKTFFLL